MAPWTSVTSSDRAAASWLLTDSAMSPLTVSPGSRCPENAATAMPAPTATSTTSPPINATAAQHVERRAGRAARPDSSSRRTTAARAV